MDVYRSLGCKFEPWLFPGALVVYWSLSCEAGQANPFDTFFTVSLKCLLEDNTFYVTICNGCILGLGLVVLGEDNWVLGKCSLISQYSSEETDPCLLTVCIL